MTNQPPPGFDPNAPTPNSAPEGTPYPPGYQPYMGNVSPGNVPPDAMPPPVPLSAYVANPAAPQPVPAAQGTVSQAWSAIALRPARERIASWAQAANDSWVRTSLIAIGVIAIISALAQGGIYLAAHGLVPSSTFGIGKTSYHTAGVGYLIAQLIEQPIQQIGGVLAFAFGLALFMSQQYGSLGARFKRALKPVALSYVGLALLSLILSVIDAGLLVSVAPTLKQISDLAQQTQTTQNPNAGQQIGSLFGSVLPAFCGIGILGIGLLTYSITVWVQAGAVGSNMNRWAVFGIGVLSAIVFAIVISLVFTPLKLLAAL